MRKGLLLIVPALMLAAPAGADIYKWTDAGGHVHFGDKVPGKEKAEPVTVRVNSYTHVTYDLPPPDFHGGGTDRQVVLYGTAWCGYCRQARAWFQANHIPFVDKDIEASAAARKEYDAMHAAGVPVILVGGKRMNGFSAEAFQQLYH